MFVGPAGGIPNDLWTHEVQEDVTEHDYELEKGSLDYDILAGVCPPGVRLPVDTGLYGTGEVYAFGDEDENHVSVESLNTTDPLHMLPDLLHVREVFLQTKPPIYPSREVSVTSTSFERHLSFVDRYMYLKQVNRQLLLCALEFSQEGGYDWVGFGTSEHDDTDSREGGYLRPLLADTALNDI